jgi:hypothetical protein
MHHDDVPSWYTGDNDAAVDDGPPAWFNDLYAGLVDRGVLTVNTRLVQWASICLIMTYALLIQMGPPIDVGEHYPIETRSSAPVTWVGPSFLEAIRVYYGPDDVRGT